MHSTKVGQVCALLLNHFWNAGTYEFTMPEVVKETGISLEQAKHVFRALKKRRIIKPTEVINANRRKIYTFDDQLEDSPVQTYSSEIIEKINEMRVSISSVKDRRIGKALNNHLSDGVVRKSDYDEKKWTGDMCLAEQMGLVEKIDENTFRILPEIKSLPDTLFPRQKRALTVMYESFGGEAFTGEMFMATLDYSHSHACAVLHELTLIRVIDCWKEDVNQYRLTVNPEQNPEFFAEVA